MEFEEHPCFRASTSSARNANKDEEETTVKLIESHELDKTDKESSETSQNESDTMAEEKIPSEDSADRADDERKKKDSRWAPASNDVRDSPEKSPRDSPNRKRERKSPDLSVDEKPSDDMLDNDGKEEVIKSRVEDLLLICKRRYWPLPQYKIVEEKAIKKHEYWFTMGCSLLKFHEMGKGRTIKAAKREAATKMWDRVQSESVSDEVVKSCIDQVAIDEKKRLNGEDMDYVSILQEIATEQKFEVTYEDVNEKTTSGLCQCLVNLTTLPVAVCQGTGVTSKDAQNDAAKNTLEYLKIVTRKLGWESRRGKSGTKKNKIMF